jgi:hypothetical protein
MQKQINAVKEFHTAFKIDYRESLKTQYSNLNHFSDFFLKLEY